MTEPTDEKWRIGTSWGIHVYQGEKGSPGERPVATFHDPADAQRAVDAVNGTADARQFAAEELRKAAEELHVARFNADDRPDARWPAGSPRVAPDTFYRGITVAELALKFRAAALAADDRTDAR